ncbi:MAG: NAD-dependent epimerase/dehydratase family protein [Planctomycetales bacterium]
MTSSERILVTGGAGFIGSHLVDLLLQEGHEVWTLDDLSTGSRANLPAGVPLLVADVCDRTRVHEVFGHVRPTAVCHLAAQMSVSCSVREPAADARTNILGWVQVLEACVAAGVRRVVFASSGGVLYGEVTRPALEDAPCAPVSPYGLSKWAGEKYLEYFAREHHLEAVALRYSNVYGPRQNPDGEAGVVAIFCQNMLAGRDCLIHGDGQAIRDYVYVADVARANLQALTRPLPDRFQVLNIGTGTGTDVNQIEALLRDEFIHLGGRVAIPPRHGAPRSGDLRSNLVAIGKARAALGWTPQVELSAGLRQTMQWFAHRPT